MKRLLVVVYLAAGATVAEGRADVAPSVALELTTDRRSYYVGEPVRLTLTVKNVGTRDLYGHLWLQPYLPDDLRTATLSYCRQDHACREFLGSIPGVAYKDMMVDVYRLAPGLSVRSTLVIAADPRSGELVLATPGRFTLRWETWGIGERAGDVLETRGERLSTSAEIDVLPVPPAEKPAFQRYAEAGLARLAQYDAAYAVVTPADVEVARRFLQLHGQSLYAVAITPGLIELLEARARAGTAIPDDASLLAELRARNATPKP